MNHILNSHKILDSISKEWEDMSFNITKWCSWLWWHFGVGQEIINGFICLIVTLWLQKKSFMETMDPGFCLWPTVLPFTSLMELISGNRRHLTNRPAHKVTTSKSLYRYDMPCKSHLSDKTTTHHTHYIWSLYGYQLMYIFGSPQNITVAVSFSGSKLSTHLLCLEDG